MSETELRAELKCDYYQRSVLRLKVTARGQESLAELEQAAIAQVQQAIESGSLDPTCSPIVELRIEGRVGFDRLELNVRQLQQELQQLSRALVFLLKYEVESVKYLSPLSQEATHQEIEQEVFTDLLTANTNYNQRASELAQGLISLKEMQLEGRQEVDLYRFIQSLLEL